MYILCAGENGYLMAGILKSLLVPGLTESKTNLLRRKIQHKTKRTSAKQTFEWHHIHSLASHALQYSLVASSFFFFFNISTSVCSIE